MFVISLEEGAVPSTEMGTYKELFVQKFLVRTDLREHAINQHGHVLLLVDVLLMICSFLARRGGRHQQVKTNRKYVFFLKGKKSFCGDDIHLSTQTSISGLNNITLSL